MEIDATTLQFDERNIADPLLGSVHDPIYQGAGAFGNAGIPRPRPGAVCEAHGGVLFIDEIGELHPVQMNKLFEGTGGQGGTLSEQLLQQQQQKHSALYPSDFSEGNACGFSADRSDYTQSAGNSRSIAFPVYGNLFLSHWTEPRWKKIAEKQPAACGCFL